MEWQFRNDSPIYTQLTQRLTQAIVAGEFRPGERLPSVRELAVEAGVNPNTVQRALADLERRHILRVLEHTRGNKAEAARLLGIGIATLYRKLDGYGVK